MQTPHEFFQHRFIQSSFGKDAGARVLQDNPARQGRAERRIFYGNCAVIRCSAVAPIESFCHGNPTEEVHTAIRMHKLGYPRLNYLASTLFFFDGWQKLVFFITPPAVFLLAGCRSRRRSTRSCCGFACIISFPYCSSGTRAQLQLALLERAVRDRTILSLHVNQPPGCSGETSDLP
ncbi:protein of unknown function (plasmid) [Cupriavidus taiwanensis]|uniref:Uncharacterized protein n=1 Tax=Cupriavidus taiwanensis TaxID=164546 RepID=A0A375ECL3_9BURK|nr:hypothetical protein [Cupriavidus taiwanensis]SOZ71305.1 protein of unknown function [Cupriavidus taiwanensis]SOZ72361.1 protein of unknown function [Cupriavidus taiwanensis]SOZ74678.1 protein of unknown function [Cupriavidus taiwanensis]SPA11465.1 protein of unknown function [Cupriavidus taiwanensis]SPA57374.1 protein of unknown function [Cupriavidus taiwanensis]